MRSGLCHTMSAKISTFPILLNVFFPQTIHHIIENRFTKLLWIWCLYYTSITCCESIIAQHARIESEIFVRISGPPGDRAFLLCLQYKLDPYFFRCLLCVCVVFFLICKYWGVQRSLSNVQFYVLLVHSIFKQHYMDVEWRWSHNVSHFKDLSELWWDYNEQSQAICGVCN